MIQCTGCDRHIRTTETACPFCAVATGVAPRIVGWRPPKRFSGILMLLATPTVLAACYGSAPKGMYETGPQDFDEDGFDNLVDCNDMDPAVYPDAEEICDDTIDNDCDTLIDGDDDDCQDAAGDTGDSG